jgi:hypothetical protein
MRRVLASAVLVLLAVAWLVATAVWNRGAVVSRITLSERELPWTFPQDEQAIRLSLDWERRLDPQDARNWLTVDRLRQVGFDLSLPATAPEAGRAYSRVLPRRAWVVFEYDGDAWRAVERRRALTQRETPLDRTAPSRLVPVDVGLNVDLLTARYPGAGHLIVPAWIQLGWAGPGAGGPLVFGSIRSLEPSSVTVPRPFADHLRALAPSSTLSRDARPDAAPIPPPLPRYEVDLAVGRLGIPWVVAVR